MRTEDIKRFDAERLADKPTTHDKVTICSVPQATVDVIVDILNRLSEPNYNGECSSCAERIERINGILKVLEKKW